ncbi:MAG: hypothetical protein IT381_01165 [Deltaproteobacteria bacterium]|nr:hypothetical protein [Deltaproteobacteria bacterium]
MRRILYVLLGIFSMGSTCGRLVDPTRVLARDKAALSAGTWVRDVRVEWQPPTERVYAIESKGYVAVYPVAVAVQSDLVREDSKPFIRLTTDAPLAEQPRLNGHGGELPVPQGPSGTTGGTGAGALVDEETGLPIKMASASGRFELKSMECELHQHCVLPFRVQLQIGQAREAIVPATEWDINLQIIGNGELVVSTGDWEKVQ